MVEHGDDGGLAGELSLVDVHRVGLARAEEGGRHGRGGTGLNHLQRFGG